MRMTRRTNSQDIAPNHTAVRLLGCLQVLGGVGFGGFTIGELVAVTTRSSHVTDRSQRGHWIEGRSSASPFFLDCCSFDRGKLFRDDKIEGYDGSFSAR
jgi:hypothetical protein